MMLKPEKKKYCIYPAIKKDKRTLKNGNETTNVWAKKINNFRRKKHNTHQQTKTRITDIKRDKKLNK